MPHSSSEKVSPSKAENSLTPAISKNSKILAIFAVACTAIVSLVFELTKDTIKAQEQKQLLNTLHSIISPDRHNNDIAKDCIKATNEALGSNKIQTAYIARSNEKIVAVALTTVAPDGYNGNIELIVAINIDGTISGVRALKHQETPGLGDKIETRKSQWILGFSGKTVTDENNNQWAVAKDGGMFDQFTGATITPRAVVKAIKRTVLYFNNNKQMLLSRPNACAAEITDSTAQEITELKNTHGAKHGN
jgi:electron transport complex protein RnfG